MRPFTSHRTEYIDDSRFIDTHNDLEQKQKCLSANTQTHIAHRTTVLTSTIELTMIRVICELQGRASSLGWPFEGYTYNINKILIIIYLIFIYMYANVVYTDSRNVRTSTFKATLRISTYIRRALQHGLLH